MQQLRLHKEPARSEVKGQCRGTGWPVAFSLRKCSDGFRDLVFTESGFLRLFPAQPRRAKHNVGSGNTELHEQASGKLTHCLYETSHGAGKTEHSNRETTISGNAIARSHGTNIVLFKFMNDLRDRCPTPLV